MKLNNNSSVPSGLNSIKHRFNSRTLGNKLDLNELKNYLPLNVFEWTP